MLCFGVLGPGHGCVGIMCRIGGDWNTTGNGEFAYRLNTWLPRAWHHATTRPRERCSGNWFVSSRHWFVTQALVCHVQVVAKGYSAGGGCPRLRVRNGLPSFSLGARTPARVMPRFNEPDCLQPSRDRHPRGSQGHCTTSNRSKYSRVLFVFVFLLHLTIQSSTVNTKEHTQCLLSQ